MSANLTPEEAQREVAATTEAWNRMMRGLATRVAGRGPEHEALVARLHLGTAIALGRYVVAQRPDAMFVEGLSARVMEELIRPSEAPAIIVARGHIPRE